MDTTRRKSARRRRRRRRTVAVVPSLFTLANGVCGFASIIMASRIQPAVLMTGGEGYAEAMTDLGIAGWLLVAGMVFDVLDGRMARLANAASRFGAELDSLCDVVSFGAAPAFLLLKLGPTRANPLLYKILFLAATFYVICTILRLARFNIETDVDEESHRYFKGLPSPAAAGCLASIAIMRSHLYGQHGVLDVEYLGRMVGNALPFATILLALLMVSNITYLHVVNQKIRGRHSFNHLVMLVIMVGFALLLPELSLVLGFWGFALVGPVRAGVLRWGWLPRKEPTSRYSTRDEETSPEEERDPMDELYPRPTDENC
ncbi:CDP-alcohol phosphatidyltransferase [Planctomycetes bacterium Pan216]|uniref:CDP-diacylglycerol--serine O-phosphatidyltransferase n=1 Tax=Kolteria novifilia TaxID=2527975 RepID=A0A518BAC8_9BACT|nr:CDP-alcohol phosphatidyltransferase [Planctomycetes bacterium Pan216]